MMMNHEATDIGQRIRHYRQRLRESQGEFGGRVGVKRLTVAKWENGSPPSRKHLTKLTQLLNDQEAPSIEASPGYQLTLPFDQTISFEVRVSPKTANSIHFQV